MRTLAFVMVAACGAEPRESPTPVPVLPADCTGRYLVTFGPPEPACGFYPDGLDLIVAHGRVRERLGHDTFHTRGWAFDYLTCRISLDRPEVHVAIGDDATAHYIVDEPDEWNGGRYHCESRYRGAVTRRPIFVADVTFDPAAAERAVRASWDSWLASGCPRPALPPRPTGASDAVEVTIAVDAAGFATTLTIDGQTLPLAELVEHTPVHACTLHLHVDNPSGRPQQFRAVVRRPPATVRSR